MGEVIKDWGLMQPRPNPECDWLNAPGHWCGPDTTLPMRKLAEQNQKAKDSQDSRTREPQSAKAGVPAPPTVPRQKRR